MGRRDQLGVNRPFSEDGRYAHDVGCARTRKKIRRCERTTVRLSWEARMRPRGGKRLAARGLEPRPFRHARETALFVALLVGLGGTLITEHAHGKPRPKSAAKTAAQKNEPPAAAPDARPDPAGADASPVKAAGTKEPAKDPKAPSVTAVEESAEDKGVKTYKFSAVDVEGRLKSPQIVYFLRRVRAEFEAGALGHRSFLPELSDTRRSPSLR